MTSASINPESQPPAILSGELGPTRHSLVVTLLLAVTGILLLARGLRLFGRLALAFRRPATVTLSRRGLEVESKTQLLGRVLRDRSELVPLYNLASVTREVRFARFGLYSGLIALTLGSYLGAGMLVDAVRVPGTSPSLFGMGLLFVALGLTVDYVLTTFLDNVRGQCQLVIVPRTGRTLSLGGVDPERVDSLLRGLALTLEDASLSPVSTAASNNPETESDADTEAAAASPLSPTPNTDPPQTDLDQSDGEVDNPASEDVPQTEQGEAARQASGR